MHTTAQPTTDPRAHASSANTQELMDDPAFLQDLLDPHATPFAIAQAHGLTLPQLAAIIETDACQQLINANTRVTDHRRRAIEHNLALQSLAALADLINQAKADARDNPKNAPRLLETARKATTAILKHTAAAPARHGSPAQRQAASTSLRPSSPDGQWPMADGDLPNSPSQRNIHPPAEDYPSAINDCLPSRPIKPTTQEPPVMPIQPTPRRRRTAPAILAALACALPIAAHSAHAQDTTEGAPIDPRGIYFNDFAGSFSGTEWFQTIPINGTNRYRLADIFSGGFNATIDEAGNITLDAGVGSGSFSSPDDYVITPNLGGSVFTFDNTRAPFTTPDFPLQLDSPIAGNPILAGTYRTLTRPVNPRTGAPGAGGFENNTIAISGNTFRITDPGGLFFQGVFETPTHAAFRVVVPQPSDTRFRTFPGSSINFTQNMLGSVSITSVNAFEAVFLLQSRAPLGSQTQNVFIMSAQRLNPLPAGDLDGDRDIDLADRTLMGAQLNPSLNPDDFNIAADLDGDLDADADDLALFADIVCLPDYAAPFGQLNFFDVSGFITLFSAADPAADIAAPFGDLNFFDVSAFIQAYTQGCATP